MADYRTAIDSAMLELSEAIESALEEAEKDSSFAKGLLADVYALEDELNDIRAGLDAVESSVQGLATHIEFHIQRNE